MAGAMNICTLRHGDDGASRGVAHQCSGASSLRIPDWKTILQGNETGESETVAGWQRSGEQRVA